MTARTDKTLFCKPLVRIQHRIAHHAELLSERTGRDELTAARNVAIENGPPQTFVEQVLLRELAGLPSCFAKFDVNRP